MWQQKDTDVVGAACWKVLETDCDCGGAVSYTRETCVRQMMGKF